MKTSTVLGVALAAAMAAPSVIATRPAVAQQADSRQTRPELVLQVGHVRAVGHLAFSPDGRLVASASDDETLRVWDVASGRELRNFRDVVNPTFAFSPDGRVIAAPGKDHTVNVWHVMTGRLIFAFSGHTTDVQAVAFSPDGTAVATADDSDLHVWSVTDRRPRWAVRAHSRDNPCRGPAYFGLRGNRGLAFTPDSRFIAAGAWDCTLKIWDATNGQAIGGGPAVNGPVFDLRFSPDGRWLVSAGHGYQDEEIRFWDLGTSRTVFALHHDSRSLAFAPDGKTLISVGEGGLRMWDLQRRQTTRTIAIDGPRLTAAAVSPDGRLLAAGAEDGAIRIWDASSGVELLRMKSHSSPVVAVACSEDGRWLATGDTRAISLWEMASGREVRRLPGDSNLNGLVFSRSNVLAATGLHGREVSIWDIPTESEARQLTTPHTGAPYFDQEGLRVRSVFSPDGASLTVRSSRELFTIRDVHSGRDVLTLPEDLNYPRRIAAFSPDGRSFVTAFFKGGLSVRDFPSGIERRRLIGHLFDGAAPVARDSVVQDAVRSLSFSPDGRLLASAVGNRVEVWNMTSGVEQFNLAHSEVVSTARFNQDGTVIATASHDGLARIWNAATGEEIHTLSGHTWAVADICFTPGNILVSASYDGTTKLWDPSAGRLLATMVSLDTAGDWLVTTPDGLFDGSPASWNQILWRFGGNARDVAPVEAFFNEFFRPGLLGEILSGGRPEAPRDIAELDRRQPAIRIVSAIPAAGAARTRRTASLKIEVIDAPADAAHAQGSGARDLRLFRNGSLVKAWRGDVLGTASRVTLDVTVPITAGPNHFTAYAFNRDDVKSEGATLTIAGAAALARKGVARVLSIGINRYANAEFNLKYAVADATRMAQVLAATQMRTGAYARTSQAPLVNRQATKTGILRALERLAAASAPEDTVIVFFAGHGVTDGARFYLVPHDLGYAGSRTRLNAAGKTALMAHSVSDLELQRAFERIDARQILLILDACHSGQALESDEKRRGPMNSKGLAQLAYEKGMYVLTAAQSYQAALEADRFGHGFLTYALVEDGLRQWNADRAPRDRTIVAREWLDFAAERVPLMQRGLLNQARGLKPAFVEGENRLSLSERNVQRPRLYYRRELDAQPLVISKR